MLHHLLFVDKSDLHVMPASWPSGYDCVRLNAVDSTMSEAMRRSKDLLMPLWILAYEQTQGRARLGRSWSDPKGNLSATLAYVICEDDLNVIALRSFVMANALYDALSQFVPESSLALKWPNDVLLKGRKVAGILLEARPSLSVHYEANVNATQLSIGVGVNLTTTPNQLTGAKFAPISLRDVTNEYVAPDEFLEKLAFFFAKSEADFVQNGFENVRQRWLSRAIKLGGMVTVESRSQNLTGVFEGVDETGCLILKNGRFRHKILAGDVYF